MFGRFLRMRGAATVGVTSASHPSWVDLETDAPHGLPGTPTADLGRVGLFCWPNDGSSSPTDAFYGSGKHVAASEWTRALVRHGRVGDVDIFVPIGEVERSRRQFLGDPVVRSGMPQGRVTLLPESELPRRFRAHVYDVLHAPMGLDLTRPGYVRSRFGSRVIPVTCSQHGISYGLDLHFGFVRLLTACIYPCDAIVCLTLASREAMRRRLMDVAERYSRTWDRPAPLLPRLELIPWGIDTARFLPLDPLAARRSLDLPIDRPILLCLGRVRVQDKMDWAVLLLIFDRLVRTVRQKPLLVLAGTGALHDCDAVVNQAVQLGLAADIRTFFNAPSACLPSLYAACDVFVSPTDSPSESFGLTVLEAMACGRPVVASDWNGYKELIVHGETGFKVRTDWADCLGDFNEIAPVLSWDHEHLHVGQSVCVDVAECADYIRILLENEELRHEMGRQARARVEAMFDWSVVIPQWEALWAELAAIAATLTPKEEDRLDHLQPNFFQHFNHYASRIVEDETLVSLTQRGAERIARRAPILLHPWARGFLDPRYLDSALQCLKTARWLGSGLPIGQVVKSLQKVHGLTRGCAMMHLMWLAKYDLVSFGTDCSGEG